MQINKSTNRSKAMWDLINEELGNQKNETGNIELNSAHRHDPKVVASVFNCYYTSIAHSILSSNLSSSNIEVGVNTVKYNSSSMFLTPATNVEVRAISKGLVNEKTIGIYDISEYIIKKCYPKFITVLTFIINL
jgi:hypothetical protein